MSLSKAASAFSAIDITVLTVNDDGYIRLSFDELSQIPLSHLISGLDDEVSRLTQFSAVFSEITGYTEWVTDTKPSISIGWDWILDFSETRSGEYKRVGEPRSNLMLINSKKHDLGDEKTTVLIETIVDEMNWQTVVHNYISARYSA